MPTFTEAAMKEFSAKDRVDPATTKAIADALRGLQFGTVTIIVQNGIVIQIDRTEKRRLVP